MSSELVDKKCDVCSKPLSAHSYGSGVPICPGIYAPGFRSTLHDRIEQLEREVARKDEALEYIARRDGKDANDLIDWQRCVNRIQEVARTALHKKDDE